jgi:6-phosphogluconate dehydrogenase
MVGLGKMGGFMTERLVRGGHRVVGYDRDATVVQKVSEKGIAGANSLEKLIGALKAPRAVWLMVPAGKPVDDTIDLLLPHLAAGDTIIDGGNSYYKDSVRRAAALKPKSINFVDCGTSGGVWGLTEGYSMMVGGDADVVKRLSPIFETLAPGKDKGWGRVGPAGAGHFVKMVHNGIEYGIMQAYAEGLDLLGHKTEFNLDLLQIGKIWQFGSVIRSWLLDLTVDALTHNPRLEGIGAYVTDSGEGRWTVIEGVELGVPVPVISGALDMRFRSQDPEPFANKLLAMMRHEFGGHAVKTAAEK